MTEFTPEPWTVSGPRKAGRWTNPAELGNIYGYTIYSAGTKTVANATCDDSDRDTCKATVRLIAAAPDLLAALEGLTACHESYCSTYGPGMDSKNADCMKPARAAILKAQGPQAGSPKEHRQ